MLANNYTEEVTFVKGLRLGPGLYITVSLPSGVAIHVRTYMYMIIVNFFAKILSNDILICL